MRILKIIFYSVTLLLISLVALWIILPRGYLLVKILEKNGISIYPEAIKEGLFTTRFYRVHLSLKGFHALIPEAEFSWRGLEVPCAPDGYLKATYRPPKNLRIVFKNFRGPCAGRGDFEKISGTLVYRYPHGLFGKLRVSGFHSPTGTTSVLLNFSGHEVSFRLGHFTHRVPLFFDSS